MAKNGPAAVIACPPLLWNSTSSATYRRADGLRLHQEASHDGDDWTVGRQTLALTDAQPLAHNPYKVRLARALIKRALLECVP